MRHLLVTNDFPPKVGGIQSYLWELWRRLPADDAAVLTTPHAGAAEFDAAAPFRIVRSREPVLMPWPGLVRQIQELAGEHRAELIVLDPALPVGLVGPWLNRPYAVVLHGAEVTVPGRLPASRQALARVLRGADRIIAAGGYPAAEGERAAGTLPPTTIVPPGVDTERFRPLDEGERQVARKELGLPVDGRLIVSVSRLVPRKGMDVLIEAVGRLSRGRPDLALAIAGSGRDRNRLAGLAGRSGAAVHLLGRVPDADLSALYGCADVFAMVCRNRWMGLEQEGFGIVFLEAAACGVPAVAGDSGGAAEAVADGETGFVVERPTDPAAVAAALARLLDDESLRRRQGEAGRRRAVEQFGYDRLAGVLEEALQ